MPGGTPDGSLRRGMDLTPIILSIVAVNVGTLLAGTALAVHRARHEARVDAALRGRPADRSTGPQTSVLAGRSD